MYGYPMKRVAVGERKRGAYCILEGVLLVG